MEEKRSFKLGDKELMLSILPGRAFQPNQTTETVYNSVDAVDGDVGIEVGSGIGPGTILIASRPVRHLYSIEYVKEQCELQRKNLETCGLLDRVTVLHGDLFEPMRRAHPDVKADFIVSDVSGMAEIPARAIGDTNSDGGFVPWYPDNIPSGGLDGTGKIIPLIEQAGQFLNRKNPNARLYFPVVVNFSDGKKILTAATSKFRKVEKIASRMLPLKTGQTQVMLDLEKENSGIFQSPQMKGSRGLWVLDMYCASEPR